MAVWICLPAHPYPINQKFFLIFLYRVVPGTIQVLVPCTPYLYRHYFIMWSLPFYIHSTSKQSKKNPSNNKEHAPWYEVFLCLLVLGLAWVGAEVPVNLRWEPASCMFFIAHVIFPRIELAKWVKSWVKPLKTRYFFNWDRQRDFTLKTAYNSRSHTQTNRSTFGPSDNNSNKIWIYQRRRQQGLRGYII